MKKKVETATLPNGLQVVYRQSSSPVAYCGLLIAAGTRDERESEHGLAHLLEHLLFKGTAKRKAHQVSGGIERLGGELNAYTGKEETMVQATVLSADFSKALEVIADMVFNSTFPQAELLKEREIVLDEIAMYKDSPAEAVFDDFENAVFAGSSLGRNILGSKKSLKTLTADHLRAFRSRVYCPSQMVLSVVGRMPFQRVLSMAHRFFAPYPTLAAHNERLPIPPYTVSNQIVSKNTHQAHCVVGGRAYAVSDDRSIGLVLLTNLLGGPSSNSRLNTILREQHALVYTVEAASTFYQQVGMFSIYFGTHKSSVGECLDIVHRELKRLCDTKLTTLQLHKAKKQLIGQLAIANDSGENLMASMAKNLLFGDQVDMFDLALIKLDKLTAEDVREIANEIFDPTLLSTLVYQ